MELHHGSAQDHIPVRVIRLGIQNLPLPLYAANNSAAPVFLSNLKKKNLKSRKPISTFPLYCIKRGEERKHNKRNSIPNSHSPMGTFFFSSTPLILISLILLLFQPSQSKTFVVDGLANWTKANPTVHVGDSLIFKYQQNLLNLYIFRNKGAFDLCNFTQATLLDNGNTQSYTWYPSRLGFFYFSFSNRSVGACEQGEKAAIKVIQKDLDKMASAPGISPSAAPSPTSGGHFPSTPAYNLPLRPHSASSPSPSSTSPSSLPDSGSGIPFINSNPAVPLPTGETDAATIRPLPMSGHGGKAVVGLLQIQMLTLYMVWMNWGLTLV